ncbi:TRAP transporter large permease subunit [Acuticoccus yangtzensis]|uniref:TRAP transporter large permease subunit n=1 Tax=Acuticoccus yangtzensis TaxID=1443441 RepID=UPI0009497035|nr:TRAP transporter large permease subunit [Acuticoccus yangtzensis]
MTIAIVVALLIAIRMTGVPVGTGLAVTGAAILLAFEHSLSPILDVLGATAANPLWVAIPLFIFMGLVLLRAGVASDAMALGLGLARRLGGGVRGGTILGATLVGAVSTVSLPNMLAIGVRVLPLLAKAGVPRGAAAALVAAAATLTVLLPPSTALILFAIAAGVRVEPVFLAALLPAGLAVVGFAVAARWGGGPSTPPEDDCSSEANPALAPALTRAFAVLLLPVLILGGLALGLVTGVEAGIAGAVYGGAVALAAPRRIGLKAAGEVAIETVRAALPILGLVLAAALFSAAMGAIGVPDEIAELVEAAGLGPAAFVLLAALVTFAAALILDPAALILVVTPLMAPSFAAAGISPVWAGPMLVVAVEAAAIAPPFGVSLYVVRTISDVTSGELRRAALRYIAVLLCVTVAMALIVTIISGGAPL